MPIVCRSLFRKCLGALLSVIVLSASGSAFGQANAANARDPVLAMPAMPPSPAPLPAAGVPGGGDNAAAHPANTTSPGGPNPFDIGGKLPDLANRSNFSSAMMLIVLLTVLSLAPAILIMMTSFTRIVIVLSLLRQAMGTQQLPPNQVMIGLAMFMTFLVMQPTWVKIKSAAVDPYMAGTMEPMGAVAAGIEPLREFMIKQIQASHNDACVDLFTSANGQPNAKSWNDVATAALVPAYVLSELKTAFWLGFQVYLPFLIIDMVVSTVLISMGMMMLPPVLISLPFKLLLFVLVDGWRLITIHLLGSFAH